MGDFKSNAINPEKLAEEYLLHYFKDQKISYPINPFQMLIDEGIMFAIRDFGKLEGVFVPALDHKDIPIVGININRPITRQRFTAAHELCHYLRDSRQQQLCPIGKESKIEKFANRFASGLLMPLEELRLQVKKRAKSGYVGFDDILEIADYFGVSFESCLFRVAYLIHAVPGNKEP